MHWLDWILLLIVVLSTIPALLKGFVYEALMIAATVAAAVVGIWKYPALAAHLGFIHLAPARNFVGFALIFLGILLLAAAIARLARKLVKAAGLSFADRLLGGALGLVRGVLICILLLVMLTVFPFDLSLLRTSALAPDFLLAGEGIAALLPTGLQRDFRAGLSHLHTIDMPPPHLKPQIQGSLNRSAR